MIPWKFQKPKDVGSRNENLNLFEQQAVVNSGKLRTCAIDFTPCFTKFVQVQTRTFHIYNLTFLCWTYLGRELRERRKTEWKNPDAETTTVSIFHNIVDMIFFYSKLKNPIKNSVLCASVFYSILFRFDKKSSTLRQQNSL